MSTVKLKLNQIELAPLQFQFRSVEVNQERVNWLVENFDPNICDPLDIWLHDGRYLLLGGHHRFTAMKQLGVESAECRIHTVSLDAAQTIALVSNSNRLAYTDFEMSRCLSFLLQSGVKLEEAANTMAISAGMAKKYYSLRHLVGSDWEVHCERLDLTSRAFEIGSFCEQNPLKLDEVQSLFKITTDHDLTVSQLRQLLRDIRNHKNKQEVKINSLFDLQEFATPVVKAVKERDFLNNVSAQVWWLYLLIQEEEKYQFPVEIKESFMRELRRVYAHCIGADKEEVEPARSNSKGRKLRTEIDGTKQESVPNNSRFVARRKTKADS